MFRYTCIGLLVIGAGCGWGCDDESLNISDSGASGGAGMDSNRHNTGQLGGTCSSSFQVGRFEVEHMPEVSITAVTGSVAQGVVPSSVMDLVERQGDCRLLRRNSLFCDPVCQSGETCAENGKCVPYPENISVGTITVTGLSRTLELEPAEIGLRYSDASIPYPGFRSGDEIALKASGGDVDPFTLRGFGVADFEFLDEAIALDRNTPLELNWVEDRSPQARVYLVLNVDQHGESPLSLECEMQDTGQAIIGAELIDALLDSGVSGIPTVQIGRRTVDSITIGPGCIDFIVMSRVSPGVDVAAE